MSQCIMSWLLCRNFSEFRNNLFIESSTLVHSHEYVFLVYFNFTPLNMSRRDHVHLGDLKIDKVLVIANFMLCFSTKHLKDC